MDISDEWNMNVRAEEQRLDGQYRNLLMSLEKVDQQLLMMWIYVEYVLLGFTHNTE